MTDDMLADKGYQAEQAKSYLVDVINRASNSLSEQVSCLYPDETMKFTVIRSQMMALKDILAVVDGDIQAGKEALERLSGEPRKVEGIL